MSISTVLRQAVSVEISLSNPLNEELPFLVSLQVRTKYFHSMSDEHQRKQRRQEHHQQCKHS